MLVGLYTMSLQEAWDVLAKARPLAAVSAAGTSRWKPGDRHDAGKPACGAMA